MKAYPKPPQIIAEGSAVLSTCTLPKVIDVPCEHIGACIVVHGVNDVGVGFQAVEEGLCQGIAERMAWCPGQPNHASPYTPAGYRMPTDDDRSRLEDDPDAVFFKRHVGTTTHSPVIPFYWGYRAPARGQNRRRNGQWLDEADNRLDKDLSKGGGPFANATTNLADMWKSGAPAFGGFIDRLSGDPLRPVLQGPGRMYFVLAAQRLAALVRMIRHYDPQDTVNIVAHSQGCLIALLAQAFLMEDGHRTADTLVLTHPPYGLEPTFLGNFSSGGGKDPAMEQLYASLRGLQTVRARLDTLINIVRGVAAQRRDGWSADELAHMRRGGLHSLAWEPGSDRDNRGKVYLYFCPEDMTVALSNVQGIGWQGVPDQLDGRHPAYGASGAPQPAGPGAPPPAGPLVKRKPLQELGPTFLQRVFTQKPRDVGGETAAFPVGLDPCHFPLRLEGEPDKDHVLPKAATLRTHLPEADPSRPTDPAGRRFINGEPLPKPYPADLYAGALSSNPRSKNSKLESVDPIDAAVAVSRDQGLLIRKERIPDPRPAKPPQPFYPDDRQPLGALERAEVQALLNAGKAEGDQIKLESATPRPDGQLDIERRESPNEARLRYQNDTSPRSFHSAIWASKANHAHVTAYDIAVGRGSAVSDKAFYAYLCAVADWRLKEPGKGEAIRPGILTWSDFLDRHMQYFECEPPEIRELIRGNCDYYSKGVLPQCVPTLAGRPRAVISETDDPGIPSFGQGTA